MEYGPKKTRFEVRYIEHEHFMEDYQLKKGAHSSKVVCTVLKMFSEIVLYYLQSITVYIFVNDSERNHAAQKYSFAVDSFMFIDV